MQEGRQLHRSACATHEDVGYSLCCTPSPNLNIVQGEVVQCWRLGVLGVWVVLVLVLVLRGLLHVLLVLGWVLHVLLVLVESKWAAVG